MTGPQILLCIISAMVGGLAIYGWFVRREAEIRLGASQKIHELEQQLIKLERAPSAQALIDDAHKELERISGMTQEQARLEALKQATAHANQDFKELREEMRSDAKRASGELLLAVIEREHPMVVTEAVAAIVPLPSEDVKGRIIGREGRNIRTFEQITGTDLVIDQAPDFVMVSCFDPVRREIARITLINLIVDGRIHPARIEELHGEAIRAVEKTLEQAGFDAAKQAKVDGLTKKVIHQMGALRFRNSLGQNVLDHSVEVAEFAGTLAAELGFDAQVARVAGFLHDVGKGLGLEFEGPHALTGMAFLQRHGLSTAVLHAVAAHHRDVEPDTPEARIVIVADSISALRPGARRETLDAFNRRLHDMESLANAMPGVERSYAMQAGREIRVIVRPSDVSDLQAAELAQLLADRIRDELRPTGEIKITVVREVKAEAIVR